VWLPYEDTLDDTVYIPKRNGACPTKSNFEKFYGNNNPAIEMCSLGTYTKSWLMKQFGVTRVFNWNAALTSDVIDAAKKPNKVALKPLGGFSSAGISYVFYVID